MPRCRPVRRLVLWLACVGAWAGTGVSHADPVGLQRALDEAGVRRHPDLVYQDLPGVDAARQRLDVYTSATLREAPIILFVHGGGWRQGDKRAVARKPLAFVPAGYVVAATNYRLRPNVAVADMAHDVARATAWLRANAGRFGGDADRIVLMGHSAGAHLVAVVGTHTAYLEAADVPVRTVRAVIALDTGPYNVPLQLERLGVAAGRPVSGYGELLAFVFGTDPTAWEAVSPWHHVGRATPPFLLFASEGRGDAAYQARPFTERLIAHGVDATFIEAKGRSHGTLNTEMGAPGDATARQVLEFLDRVLSKEGAG